MFTMKFPKTDYRLAGCVVLWAAVLGTRKAYHEAMKMLPEARNHDFHNPKWTAATAREKK